jgi:polyferredoxin
MSGKSMNKIDRSVIRKLRSLVQWLVFAMVLYAGITFYFFVDALERGVMPIAGRAPSVEGFLPIGALMSLRLFITEGFFDPVHPASLVIFTAAIVMSLLLKKSFCGWICPVGTCSELVAKPGGKLFKRHISLPGYADYPLRSIKYVLMAFFLYIILIKMSTPQISAFLKTPYWKVADIKLLIFFTAMSLTTKITLAILFALSLFYRSFWCRYLCPYGGLLGLLSMLSPSKIRRNEAHCIQCGQCTANCPSLLPVSTKQAINSPECTGCLTCVSYCKSKGALDMALPGQTIIKPALFIVLIAVVFFGVILLARLTGHWHSSVSLEELRTLISFVGGMEHP